MALRITKETVGDLFKKELGEIYAFSKRNYSLIVVISSAILFLFLNRYYPIEPEWLSSWLYFVILPVLVIIVCLRRNPLDFGFRIGHYRVWSWHAGLAILISIPVLYAVSRISVLREYYLIEQFALPPYSLKTASYLFTWEFLFRGFLLFGLKDKLKEGSILVQMIPFALLHFGKPEIETISTVLMGIYFGYVVYRGNSLWPAFLIHLFINIPFVAFVNLL